MDINEGHDDSTNDDTDATEYITISSTSYRIDVSGERNPKHHTHSLAELDKTPGAGKISSSHFFKEVHFEGILVSPEEYTINPDKNKETSETHCLKNIINHYFQKRMPNMFLAVTLEDSPYISNL